MIKVSRQEFEELVNKVVAQLPKDYLARIKNVAFIGATRLRKNVAR